MDMMFHFSPSFASYELLTQLICAKFCAQLLLEWHMSSGVKCQPHQESLFECNYGFSKLSERSRYHSHSFDIHTLQHVLNKR